MQPLPGTIEVPDAEVVVDGLPGREVVGKQASGAAAAHDVKDGVEDFSRSVCILGRPGALGEGR